MAGKITEMTDGSALAATDRFEVTRDPTGSPLTRWIDGADVTARVLLDFAAASTSTAGKVALATIAQVNTGTDATRAVTPDSLEGSALQIKVDAIEALADVTDATNVAAATAVMDADTASTTSKGAVELATTAEMDTGTDTGRAMGVNEFNDSDWGTKEVGLEVFGSTTNVVTGNGTTGIPISASMDGFNVVGVLCTVHTKGITGATTVVVRKRTGGVDSDVLSTGVTIGDEFFASDGTIDTGEDDVATGDNLYIDVDGVHTTKPKGLSVVILLRKP